MRFFISRKFSFIFFLVKQKFKSLFGNQKNLTYVSNLNFDFGKITLQRNLILQLKIKEKSIS